MSQRGQYLFGITLASIPVLVVSTYTLDHVAAINLITNSVGAKGTILSLLAVCFCSIIAPVGYLVLCDKAIGVVGRTLPLLVNLAFLFWLISLVGGVGNALFIFI
jgi:hypothetical protein